MLRSPAQDGWGLTNDGSALIMTDSGSELLFIDPVSFKELRRVKDANVGQIQSQMLTNLYMLYTYNFNRVDLLRLLTPGRKSP